ncbi:MarR family winged helix-turn-helix transcriptional regulator [Paeniglutamicibacter terrestris]|uniref:MarR family transcriptional regulator n=1 Tax=Paeniglutamicibacter terrestris TaxID=2723403 RepID=A0ABX1G3M5_9MICC|nr:MarR family transcriptional regulator [Paeniglutamicibacter terrestris]ASN39688.1 MarR family transcriptional regulator [Arthrobacter sp. 7749]NKG20559.1 MarR family transcriptional regulator [Paeniglutamicibacter terrestris]
MPNNPASLRSSTAAWEALFRAQVTVMREIQKLPEFKALSTKEYDVLFNLSRCPSGSSRLTDLNQYLLISQPSLSRMAERLESKGLLSRHPDPTDQRAVLFTLTEEGARLQKAVGREHIKGIHALIGKALSAEEFETLQELSTKLRLHMEAR